MALPFSGLIMLLCTVLIAMFVAYWYGHPSSGGIKQWAIVVWVGMILIMVFGGVRRIINANPEQLGHYGDTFQLLQVCVMVVVPTLWNAFFYRISERPFDRLLVLSVGWSALMLGLSFVDPEYGDVKSPKFRVFQLMGFIPFLLGLYVMGRAWFQSTAGSFRRKRIGILLLIFIGVSAGVLIPNAVSKALGVPNIQEVSAVALSTMIFISLPFFSRVFIRYGLLRLELDDVAEGMFARIEMPVLLLAKDGRVVRANPCSMEVLGLASFMSRSRAERRITEIVPDFAMGEQRVDRTLKTTQGERVYDCASASVTHLDEPVGTILMFRDVTRERELAEMKTEFTSNVSHELRTPLTSVLGFARIIQKRFKSVIMARFEPQDKKEARAVKQIADNLEVIISEGKRLTSLINNVLDISKMEAGKTDWSFVDCDPTAVIDQAISATDGLFGAKPVALVREVAPDLPHLTADGNRLVQVIINLISNAVKFTEEGTVTVSAEVTSNAVRIKVSDTGAGIAPEDTAKVFEKYRQVGAERSNKPRGTGLGLPISKEIVEAHGGELWVESAVGEGSTFAFTLPLSGPPEAPA